MDSAAGVRYDTIAILHISALDQVVELQTPVLGCVKKLPQWWYTTAEIYRAGFLSGGGRGHLLPLGYAEISILHINLLKRL